MEFTGERLTSAAVGQVQFEHLHRYFFARTFCAKKDVLDVASGEGYGSAYLAHRAKSVIGVEINPDCVNHAVATYARPNLTYQVGDARRLDFPNASFDVVVSFETVEHIFEQEEFVKEVKRVLRPEGLFLLSTPNRDVYSPLSGLVNEFHVKELKREELEALLRPHFSVCEFYAQRSMLGSVLFSDDNSVKRSACRTFERRDDSHFEASHGLARTVYYVVVASDRRRINGFHSVYIDSNDVDLPLKLTEALRRAEEEAQSAKQQTDNSRAELEAIRGEVQRIRAHADATDSNAAALQTELETARAEVVRAVAVADAAKEALSNLNATTQSTQLEAALLRAEAESAKELRREMEKSKTEAAYFRGELDSVRAEAARILTELEKSKREFSAISEEATRRLAKAKSLSLELQALRSEFDRTVQAVEAQSRSEREAHEIALRGEREALRAFRESTSWRLTRPMRALRYLLKGRWDLFAAYARTHKLSPGTELSSDTPSANEIESTDDEAASAQHITEPTYPSEEMNENDLSFLYNLISERFGSIEASRIMGYYDLISMLENSARDGRAIEESVLEAQKKRLQKLAATQESELVDVSIVIPVFNQVKYTAASVVSVLEHATSCKYEIIIADDCSTDQTSELFEAVGGNVRVVKSNRNQGFLKNCNQAAGLAKGRWLVFVNNDTLVLNHWLDELIDPFTRLENVGMVGSKLLSADGYLQEAGGILWKDGSAWNFGRGQDPRNSEFNYLKDVDYCSAGYAGALQPPRVCLSLIAQRIQFGAMIRAGGHAVD